MSHMRVSQEARQEAVAVYQCPHAYTTEQLAGLEKVAGLSFAERDKHAGDLKPETFGRLGRLVERSVDPVVSAVEIALPLGRFGLCAQKQGEEEPREVRPGDIRNWKDLDIIWAQNLREGIKWALVTAEPEESVAMQALWKVRTHGIVTLERMMTAGGNTATVTCPTLERGMDNFLKSSGISDGEQRGDIIGRSHGPVLELAGLIPAQQDAFDAEYSHKATVNGQEVEFHGEANGIPVFKLGRQNRINFAQPIEEFPISGGSSKVGHVGSSLPGARIGCPVLLTPKLTKRLWAAHVGTARAAGLLGSIRS